MAVAKAKKYPIVEVEWVDSLRTGGWRLVEEYEKTTPATCWTAGYLLKSNRKEVTVVQSHDPGNGNVNDSTTIPRSAVKKITMLVPKEG